MRDVSRRFTWWLAGYYDDFNSARAIPDDDNSPGSDYKSSKTHHGNPMNGYATLNPRYTYAWVDRSDYLNRKDTTITNRKAHTLGYHRWLGFDLNRRNPEHYEGRPQLLYPDGLANANRQKYDGGTGIIGDAYQSGDTVEGYLLFTNGYDTTGTYYAWTGDNDATFGRSNTEGLLEVSGGAGKFKVSNGAPTELGGSAPNFKSMAHLAGVFQGEIPFDESDSNTSDTAFNYIHPVTSPAGKPFLVLQAAASRNTRKPLITYDGSLNSVGDGDIVAFRMCSFFTHGNSNIRFRIGTNQSPDEAGGNTWAIDYEIANIGNTRNVDDFYLYDGSTRQSFTQDQLWDDYEFVLDYTNLRFDVYKNGTSVATNQAFNQLNGSVDVTPATMNGWEIDFKHTISTQPHKAYILLDRVGLIRPLTDHPDGTDMPPVEKMAYNSVVNGVSTVSIDIIDDDGTHDLIPLMSGSSFSGWELLMFRDADYRPLWRGFVEGINYSQSAINRTPTLQIRAADVFRQMDYTLPTWELGQGDNSGSTSTLAFRRDEAQGGLDLYYFGATPLEPANPTLGFNYTRDSAWVNYKDSRMRLRSAHPIQIYNNEDTKGPNDAEDDWDGETPQYRGLHARWVRDFPLSQWFQHMFGRISKEPLATTTVTTDFAQDATSVTVTGASVHGHLINGGHVEFVDSNGLVDSAVVTSSSVAVTRTWHFAAGAGSFGNDVMIGDEETLSLLSNYGVSYSGTGMPLSSAVHSVDSSGSNRTRVLLFIKTTIAAASGSRIYLTGWPEGSYRIRYLTRKDVTARGSTTSYRIYYLIDDSGKILTDKHSSDSDVSMGQGFLHVGKVGTDAYYAGNRTGTAYFGNTTLTLPSTNFLQRAHSAGETVNVRNVNTSDFKHVWVLWADMRNDGTADADGGLRKEDFGLMNPLVDNYNVSLYFADNNDNLSDRTKFVDLAIGQDVNIFSLGSHDPITNADWGNPTGGSDNETTDSNKYKNWEDKAGSFILIDTSPFFNLNNHVNNGKTGQIGAANKEIGDFLVETEGFPVLIDNYWSRVPATWDNVGSSSVSVHSNEEYLLNPATTLKREIENGDKIIELTDVSEFPTGVRYGQIVSFENKQVYHFKYDDVDDFSLVHGSSGTMTFGTDGTLTLQIPDTQDIARLEVGDELVIASSTTTTDVDGTYYVGSRAVTLLNHIEYKVYPDLTAPGSIQTGNATISVPSTTKKLLALNLYEKVDLRTGQSAAPGQWDGTVQRAKDLLDAEGDVGSLASNTIEIKDDNDNLTDYTVYATVSAIFPMRLIMEVTGFVKNENSGTYYEHDKMRVTTLDLITKTWLTQGSTNALFDINNVPVTRNMKIGASTDSYGSVNDARSQSFAGIVSSTKDGITVSETSGLYSQFIYRIGRDGRFELRPTYGSGFAFTRDNLNISNIATNNQRQISNVRVFYAGDASFVDYPAATLGSQPRWQVIHLPQVFSKDEAEAVARQEYEKFKQAPLSVSARIVRHDDGHNFGGTNDTMLDGARYGYIADPYVTMFRGNDYDSQSTFIDTYAFYWMSRHGGTFHPGMVSALDGRGDGSGPASKGTDNVYTSNYYWYGSNSVGYALQVVHIPKDMPKTAETAPASGWSDGNLRTVIGVRQSQSGTITSPEDAEFTLYLAVPYFDDDKSLSGNIQAGTFYTSTNLTNNGFYEVDIPSSYWSGGSGKKITFSVNVDYLRALVRNRCNNDNSNHHDANDITGITSSVTTNSDSVFPLGFRTYSELPGNHRGWYYAPRLLITDDLNFMPGTTLDYTDARLNLSAEEMAIQKVSWNINAAEHEDVNLTLERDASRAAATFASYIKPRVSKGVQHPTDPQSGTTKPDYGRGTGAGTGRTTGGRSSGDTTPNYKDTDDFEDKVEDKQTKDYRYGDGTASTTNGQNSINLSNVGSGLFNAVKGANQLPDLVGDNFAVLGQKKPSPTPGSSQPTGGGLDTQFVPSDGAATAGNDGMTFPGSTDNGVTSSSATSRSSVRESAAIAGVVLVSARVTVGGSSGNAVLYTEVTCPETGHRVTVPTTIAAGTTDKSTNLFSGIIKGASTKGNTIVVKIARDAGYDTDTATYSGVTLTGYEVRVTRNSVAGSKATDSFTYSA